MLPLVLQLVDHYDAANRALGLRALRHVLAECDAMDLRPSGLDRVLYEALSRLFHITGDAAVVAGSMACWALLLPTVRGPWVLLVTVLLTL